MTTLAHALAKAQQQLVASDTSRLDAEVLLAFVLGCNRSYLFTWPEQSLTLAQQAEFQGLLQRRMMGEPVAYLTGEKEFWSLSLCVNDSTLIPRPETELLVELALQKLPNTCCKAMDLGTGTGAIALALAIERPPWHVYACDVNPDAVFLAKHNAAQLQLDNVTVFLSEWFESEWFRSMDKKYFDLIISNPPYIDAEDVHLSQGDVQFEPRSALVAANKGLADIESISNQAGNYLRPSGWLMLEHGFAQGEQVRSIFRQNSYDAIETFRDLAGHERITIGQKNR